MPKKLLKEEEETMEQPKKKERVPPKELICCTQGEDCIRLGEGLCPRPNLQSKRKETISSNCKEGEAEPCNL